MNSNAPKIPLIYISKTNVNCFGPLPNNRQKIQSQESLQGPVLLLVIKSSSFCGLKKVGQVLGLWPKSAITTIFEVVLWLQDAAD